MKKILVVLVLGFLSFFCITALRCEEPSILKPIRSLQDTNFADAEEFILDKEKKAGMEQTNIDLLRLMYIRGFFDAVEAEGMGKGTGHTFWNPNLLEDLQGMDLKQIRDTMVKFYNDYPQFRDEQPSMVIMKTLPRLKKGLLPVPAAYSAVTAPSTPTTAPSTSIKALSLPIKAPITLPKGQTFR